MRTTARTTQVVVVMTFACVASSAITSAEGVERSSRPTTRAASQTTSSGVAASDPATWTTRRLSSPGRVQVMDASGVLATFTVGARTVTLRGATRTFAEPVSSTAKVTTPTWVRVLDQPFVDEVDIAWLVAARADTTPDVLATAMQYVSGMPTVLDRQGQVLAGDASYGPLQPDGTRQEGSDFNDYLQVPWSYASGQDTPEASQAGALDCSGYVRMVLGYRHGVAMTLDPDGVRLPRRAVQMASSAPGVVTVRNAGTTPSAKALDAIAPGDLLFFDASRDDGTAVDHVAIYLGRDSTGAPRFVSSRKTVDGPTLGDVGGRSLLTGSGLYAVSWRAARRI